MRILCIGVNHKTAPLAVRERLAFEPGAARSALAELHRRWPEAEFAVLSTCNRTEIYTARPIHGYPREADLVAWLGEYHRLRADQYAHCLFTLTDADAVDHLFQVAAGMDSLVPGEVQIVSQVKASYALAQEIGSAGRALNELFQTALHTAKHVRNETDIAAGRVSIASVAIDAAVQTLDSLGDKCVLAIGAGKMSSLMLRHLRDRGVGRLLLANRSPDSARQLADEHGGTIVQLAELPDHLTAADVVLCSTASAVPLITRQMVRAAQDRRQGRPVVIVDIAVPRDVEPAAAEVDGVRLFNVDDLEQVVRRNVSARFRQRPQAEATVRRHVADALHAINTREVAPTLKELYRQMADIADEELAAARNRLADHPDAEEDIEVLQRTLHRTIRRILHPAAKNLRASAGTSAAGAHANTLRKLFELADQPEEPVPGETPDAARSPQPQPPGSARASDHRPGEPPADEHDPDATSPAESHAAEHAGDAARRR